MNVEYKPIEELWGWADDFRAQFAQDTVPLIDVVYIAEVDLGMVPLLTPQLFSKIGMDAALAPDLKSIYIDEEAYLKWEAGQHWIEKRMRFSIAHELGHLVLHGDLIKGDRFQSLEDFKRWAGSPENYRTAEYQANEFAGRLLVPLGLLQEEFDRYRAEAEKLPDWWEISGMREYIAKKIAPRFGVNPQVIEVRFDHEGLWPVN
jgi:hypothetical protein